MQAQASNMVVDPHITQMNQFRSYVTMLGDPNCKDVFKLKATQEISKNFEVTLRKKQRCGVGFYFFFLELLF